MPLFFHLKTYVYFLQIIDFSHFLSLYDNQHHFYTVKIPIQYTYKYLSLIKMAKKILMVTRNLPPLIGGMERLNWHIADELSHENEIFLLSHTKAQNNAPTNCNFYGVSLNPLTLFLITAFIKTFLICVFKRPDILFAGSGLTAPIVVFWAKLFRKKSVIYLHGLDINNTSYTYQKIWIPFIGAADSIICNSSPTKKLALNKGVCETKIHIIHPGVSFPPKQKNELLIKKLKDNFFLHQKKILLSVGRLTERKGLLEFIEKCLPQIIQEVPETVLVVIGDTASNALNNKFQKKEDLVQIAKKINIDKHIIFTGAVEEEELRQFYYMSDIHVFPVKHIQNDPEGFGMVAIEAASYGIPTIAFATGGVIDAIKHHQSGILIAPDDYNTLSHSLIDFIKNKSITSSTCQNFASKFCWKNTGALLNEIILSDKN